LKRTFSVFSCKNLDTGLTRMSRISSAFEQARAASRMTFMPFVTAGDPDLQTTRQVLLALRDAKVDLIELGFPYSDPIADGPVIQASYTRALNNGITVHGILDLVADMKTENLPPILAMVSFAIVFRFGVPQFAERAASAGFSGLIIPDLPAEEAADMSAVARANGLDLVQLIAPTTTANRTEQILSASTGFLYCISVAGTTGVRTELPAELTAQLRQLRTQTKLPLAVGFGISSPEQVGALAGVADGVIVGSAIVRQAAEGKNPEQAAANVRKLSDQMAAAVSRTKPSVI
jgi:tryptophan synthase alpha chain